MESRFKKVITGSVNLSQATNITRSICVIFVKNGFCLVLFVFLFFANLSFSQQHHVYSFVSQSSFSLLWRKHNTPKFRVSSTSCSNTVALYQDSKLIQTNARVTCTPHKWRGTTPSGLWGECDTQKFSGPSVSHPCTQGPRPPSFAVSQFQYTKVGSLNLQSQTTLQTETVVHSEQGPVHDPRLFWCKEQDATRHFLRCQQLLVGNRCSCSSFEHLQQTLRVNVKIPFVTFFWGRFPRTSRLGIHAAEALNKSERFHNAKMTTHFRS